MASRSQIGGEIAARYKIESDRLPAAPSKTRSEEWPDR
jgi:hypothetical protein